MYLTVNPFVTSNGSLHWMLFLEKNGVILLIASIEKTRKKSQKGEPIVTLIIFDTFSYWTFNNGVYKVQVILKTSITLIHSTHPTRARLLWRRRRSKENFLSPKCFYGCDIYFLLLFSLSFSLFSSASRDVAIVVSGEVSQLWMCCMFVCSHAIMCVCVCLSMAKHVANSMCLIINSVLVNFAVQWWLIVMHHSCLSSWKNFNIHQQIPHEEKSKRFARNISGETQ